MRVDFYLLSFFQLMNGKSDYGGKFSHLLHEKLKVWLKKNPQKAKGACSIIREFIVVLIKGWVT